MADLNAKARNALPSSDFAIPSQRAYPIEDLAHAEDALARASGKSVQGQVDAAVYRKYPQLKHDPNDGRS